MTYIKNTWVIGDPITADKLNNLEEGVEEAINSASPIEYQGYYAACGDSITHANHTGVTDIAVDDPFMPIDGYVGTVYKRQSYAYYIAKNNNLHWANYGYGGTTMHHCAPKAYPQCNPELAFVNTRKETLKEGIEWDYISLFFGYNDATYGPAYQKDLWLTETYGTPLGYPVNANQVGTSGFADATQKAACDDLTGTVNGVDYATNDDYFYAKFVGGSNDITKYTLCGAYNITIEYLMKKYLKAKIMLVVPYMSGTNLQRKLVQIELKKVAKKWGISFFDFNDLGFWFYKVDYVSQPLPNPGREDGRWYTEGGPSYAGTTEGYNRARFTRDGTHPNNAGYIRLSGPIGAALLLT